MKLTTILLTTALMGAFTLTMAEDTTTSSVDTQIQQIQNASPSERVELMNEFKQRVMTMNQEDRQAAIKEMQARQSQVNDQTKEDRQAAIKEMQASQDQLHTKSQEGTRTAIQEMQTRQNQDMEQFQNMNQQQAGNQFGKMMGQGQQGGSTNKMR